MLLELKEYVIPLRKWWWLIVAATLVAMLSSYFATRQQPSTYRSSTTLLVGTAAANPNPTGNEFYLAQQLASTYIEIAQRETVRNATMTALSLDWLPEYTMRMIPNTQLIEISVVDINPERAQAVARELAVQLVQLAPTSSGQETEERQAFVNQQLDELEAKIAETQDEIVRLQNELADLFSARQIADTENQITALESKLNTLQANYASLLAGTGSGAVNTLSIVEPATLPTTPIGPNKLYTILLAAAIGFILAAGAAYLMEYLDDTLKTPEDVQRDLGLATLGLVPAMDQQSDESALITLTDSKAMTAEAYRVLSTNLRFTALDTSIRSMLVTSAAPMEGKSLTAANLATAIARTGQRVILVDADLRRPGLHRLFDLRNDVGVTSALLEDHPDLGRLLQPTAVPDLRLLTSGRLPPNPTDLLGSTRMRNLLDRLVEQADVVVLDAPPAIGMADAAILAAQVDGSLLILEYGRTRRGAAQQAMSALQQVGARILGVVLNRIPPRHNSHYYYTGLRMGVRAFLPIHIRSGVARGDRVLRRHKISHRRKIR